MNANKNEPAMLCLPFTEDTLWRSVRRVFGTKVASWQFLPEVEVHLDAKLKLASCTIIQYTPVQTRLSSKFMGADVAKLSHGSINSD